MPVLTITAVDHTTGILTSVAHDQTTGDGPGALYTPDGALPTGWAPVTDYWFIRVDADSLKLAASSADAMAGTAIALPADDGSGTLELLYGIPYRRARTYVPSSAGIPGSQLKSDDLNAFEDSLAALWNLLTGQAQTIYTGLNFFARTHGALSFQLGANASVTRPAPGFGAAVVSLTADNGYVESPMEYAIPGYRIGRIEWRAKIVTSGFAQKWTLALMRQKDDGSDAETVDTADFTPATNGWETFTRVVNHDVAAGYSYFLYASGNTNASELLRATVSPA